jgi:Alpha-L-arabinofuranosidase B (ABFB) domain
MPYFSFQSMNFPDRFIRHQNFLGELTPILTDLDREDATFEVGERPTFGDPVVFRAVNFPLHVLRHQDFRIKLHEFMQPFFPPPGSGLGEPSETPEQRLLREDSTFIVRPGQAAPNNPDAFSFESVNFPNHFIRHRDFHLFLEQLGDSDVARQDATFIRHEPFAPPPVPIIH